MAFADVVPVPLRNIHHHIALDHRLASKARMQLIIGRLLHAVQLIVFHLGKIGVSLFDHHMTGRTRTTSAARVLQMEAEIHRDIQQRFGLAMTFVGQFSGLKFECLTGWQEGHFRH